MAANKVVLGPTEKMRQCSFSSGLWKHLASVSCGHQTVSMALH